MKNITFFLIVSLIAVGCSSGNELGQLLFENKDCAAPCLLGITPGETTESEAKTIIPNNNLFRNCQEYDYTNQGGIRGIGCESINIVFSDDFVVQLGFSPTGISLEQVINKYGSPNTLVVIRGNLPEVPSKVKAGLWYKDIQTQITLPEQGGDAYQIDPDIQVEQITYYSKDEYENITKTMLDSDVWQGFRSYPGKLP